MAAALVLLILLPLPGTATAAVPKLLLKATAAWNGNSNSSGTHNPVYSKLLLPGMAMVAALVLLILLPQPGTEPAVVPQRILQATATWNGNGSCSGAPNAALSAWNYT